jgi:hypothetical protein
MKVKEALDSVLVNKGAFDLYLAEMSECHRLLDLAGIPKEAYGQPLSIAQRVELATIKEQRLAKHPAN